MINLRTLKRAMLTAKLAHRGQVDKAGFAYIWHPARVAKAVRGDHDAEAVAWLHDVLEDCPEHSRAALAFPANIQEAVILLTRTPKMTDEIYYGAIRKNRLALKVKVADIADNLDEERLSHLEPEVADRLRKKYAKALEFLLQPVDATVTKAT